MKKSIRANEARNLNPFFNLGDMLESAGRGMLELSERLGRGDEPLTQRDCELAKTAITATQLNVLEDLSAMVVLGDERGFERSVEALTSLMEMKAEF